MNWRKLYPRVNRISTVLPYFLICTTCASATVGILYLQAPFEDFFQYLPAVAALLYFVARLAYVGYYNLTVTKNELLAYFFILCTAVALVGQAALNLDANDLNNRSSWEFTFNAWIYNILYLFAGAACTQAHYKKSNIFALALALLVVVPLLNTLDGGLFVDYYKLKQVTGNQNLSHLYISEWCVFLFFGAYAFSNKLLRPILLIVAVASLFAMQGRSSTLFTFFTLVSFTFLIEGKKIFYTAALCAVLAGVAFVFLPVADVFFDANDRALDRMTLSTGEDDNSLQGRSDILMFSIGHLPKSALFGDPTFIALKVGTMGSYIHNLLSMWQFFGVLPFLLMVVMLWKGLGLVRVKIKQGQLTVMDEIASMLLIYVVVSVVLAKSVIFYWLWFIVGYWMLKFNHSAEKNGKHSGKRRKRSQSKKRSKKVIWF